jgi:hypothetical protein
MIQQAPAHPINEALTALSPVIGANFQLDSVRDHGGAASPFRYPRIDYAVILEDNAEFLPGQKVWRVTQTIQLDYLTTEEKFLCQCKETRLAESQAIQAVQKSYTDKIRSLITFLIDPTIIKPELRKCDFPFARFEWKFVNWITAFYFRRHGADQETGASVRVNLSFLDVDSSLCCTAEELAKIQALAAVDSVSWKLLENEINP